MLKINSAKTTTANNVPSVSDGDDDGDGVSENRVKMMAVVMMAAENDKL